MGDMASFHCFSPGCGWELLDAHLGAGMAVTGETLLLCRHCEKITRVLGVPVEDLFREGAEVEVPTRCATCGRQAEPWGEDDYDAQGDEIEGSANLSCPNCGEDVGKQIWGIWD